MSGCSGLSYFGLCQCVLIFQVTYFVWGCVEFFEIVRDVLAVSGRLVFFRFSFRLYNVSAVLGCFKLLRILKLFFFVVSVV